MSHTLSKALSLNTKATAASFFESKSATYLIICNVSTVMYTIQINSFFANCSILPKVRD